jgi:hypothetical protein
MTKRKNIDEEERQEHQRDINKVNIDGERGKGEMEGVEARLVQREYEKKVRQKWKEMGRFGGEKEKEKEREVDRDRE